MPRPKINKKARRGSQAKRQVKNDDGNGRQETGILKIEL
jgi:hypothetical protein